MQSLTLCQNANTSVGDFSYNLRDRESGGRHKELQFKAYLYDANGNDEEVSPEDMNIKRLKEDQLLWINVLERDDETLEYVSKAIELDKLPFASIGAKKRRPHIEKFEKYFRFRIDSVRMIDGKGPEKIPIDFVVGKNFVVTVHDGEIEYFSEFRQREKGQTQLGELDAERFLATLLDLHLVSYFKAMEELERRVDNFDEKVLKSDLKPEDFLARMVGLRADASKLRRWLLPHRDLFYSLSRADFQQIVESDATDEYRKLNEHFETAVDAIEHAREMILSIFDLYATKSAHETNNLIRKLTFFTLVVGSLGVIAGIFGMNYQLSYFETENGFWFTVGAMLFIASTWATVAKLKGWLG